MGRNGEESVEKKCTSNLDTGLIRGIILMIIPLSSPLDFVLVARNQIRITGAFFLTDLAPFLITENGALYVCALANF